MSKYIVQHRRGTAAQWAEKDMIIPMEGELVIEIDEENAQHKLKIGDGIHTYADLAYLQAGDEIITQALAKVLPRVVTVTLDVDQWVEVTSETDPNLGYYKQTVTLDGITARSRLDLQPNVDMLAEFQSLNLVFTTENKNGVITVYSVGDMPLKSYTMQATIVETEVIVESEQVVGIPIGTPTAKANWAQTDETKADYIKNKPENLATTDYVDEKVAEFGGNITPGEFLEIDDDGKLEIITSYDYDGGTITEKIPFELFVDDIDYAAHSYYLKPKYPVKELDSVEIFDEPGWNSILHYELLDDGTIYIVIEANEINTHVEVTYTYDAGTRSLFDELDIPDTTIDTKIENGVLYIKYGDSEEYTEVGKVVGADGVGISSIKKTGSEGLVDTYTVTYTDETTTTFTVTNGKNGDPGNGISDISKTSTEGLVDTYTITFTDNSTTTFDVTNGKDGEKGESGVYVGSGEMPDGCIIQVDLDGDPDEYYKEEWIDLADITLEEAVSYIAFDKDVNGQSFSVKRLVAKLDAPEDLLYNVGLFVSTNKNLWGGAYAQYAPPKTARRITAQLEVTDKFTEIKLDLNGSNETSWGKVDDQSPRWIRPGKTAPITAFYFGLQNTVNLLFPAGTTLKVWGVEA
jgi:hypothetical protein